MVHRNVNVVQVQRTYRESLDTVQQQLARTLDGAGELLGMNGAILIGFLFALPANELAIPVILMLLTRQSLGTAPEAGAAAQLAACGVGAKSPLDHGQAA